MAKKSTKQAINTFFGLGYHIWVILILANVLLVYSFQFYTKAAPQDSEPVQIVQQITSTPEPTETPTPTITPTPVGPVLNVSFELPGIGTKGANVKPLHPTRDLFILFYPPKENSEDRSVKPAFTLTSFVNYDDNPQSPTYTKFINPYIDLGEQFQKGDYQLVFKMDQMLAKLVKEKETAIGGKVFELEPDSDATSIPPQTFIVGDIYDPPRGDNIMDSKDHEMLLACFGEKANTSNCENKENADLNDDGIVNGVDYNLMLGSFGKLKAMGIAVPSLYLVSPTTEVTKKPAEKPKASPTTQPTNRSSGGAIAILFVFVLILLGVGGFFAYKKGLLHKLMNPSPKTSPTKEEQNQETPGETTDQNAVSQLSEEAQSETLPETTTEEQTTEDKSVADLEAPPTDMPTVDTIDKEYYVKTKEIDKEKNGVWLTLTDDNGPIEGYYSKGTDVQEGFAKVEGQKKIEDEKVYIEISEIITDA